MNKKTKIKILLFTVLSSFLFLNCEKEDDNLNEKKEVQITYENIRRINNLEIQKNKVISSKLNSLNQELNVKRQSRAIYSEEFDFYIETDYATYIENQTNEYHSYTFPIYRSIDTNILENLVFSLNPDGTYRTVIVSYNISAQEKQNLLNGREVNLEGKITYTEINGNELSTDIFGKIDGSSIGNCMGYVSMTWCGCNNPEHQGGMENGAPCPCYRYDREYFGCGNSSGGSDSGAGDTGSGTGPASSESGGSGTGGGSVSTSPTPIDYQKLREKCFAQNNPDVSSWLNQPENADIKNDVIDYLENSVNTDGLQSTESCYDESSEEFQNIMDMYDILDDGMVNGEPILVGPDVPIYDMAEYLSCFNTSLGATITIYADQPVTGSHSLFSFSETVGHAFVSIKQGTNIATLGFYPISSTGSLIQPTPGIFGNDEGHSFDTSISMSVNSPTLTNVINGFISASLNPTYDLHTMNCTDIAIIVGATAGFNIPSCESPTPWNGQTPGTLGEIIRAMPTPSGGSKNLSGGNSPANNCN